jgi:hypothetical protein
MGKTYDGTLLSVQSRRDWLLRATWPEWNRRHPSPTTS